MPRDLDVSGSHIYLSEYWGVTVRDLDLTGLTSSSLVGPNGPDVWATADGIGNAATFNWIDQIGSDGTYIYIPNDNVIQRMHIATRVVETIAGQVGVATSIDGVGTAATFNYPTGVAVSGNNLFVSECTGKVIRKIDLTSMNVTTVAGTAGVSGSADGVGALARFNCPEGITLVGTDLYAFEYGNHLVRKVDTLTGTVTTIAGQAGVASDVDGTGTAATFNGVQAGVHLNGFLYAVEYSSHVIRKINLATAEVSAFAGTINTCGKVDGTGPAAQFCYPYSITTDGTYLYVADGNTDSIRKIDPATAEVTTLAGVYHRTKDATGPYASTPLLYPSGIVWTPSGLFFTSDGHSLSWIH
jgi:hypothetical protein